ncbi:hypothetical protein DOY81_013761 [Sarcophaga bullata]|nr:hypothetical protein DOY81_013761 [Sarcophaga bullata]
MDRQPPPVDGEINKAFSMDDEPLENGRTNQQFQITEFEDEIKAEAKNKTTNMDKEITNLFTVRCCRFLYRLCHLLLYRLK